MIEYLIFFIQLPIAFVVFVVIVIVGLTVMYIVHIPFAYMERKRNERYFEMMRKSRQREEEIHIEMLGIADKR